jgi:gamma-glutamyltranspeptidase/glutathione hydrolase
LLALSLFWAGCEGIHVSRSYDRGAVASADPIATTIGIDKLRQGGNAFDAAVAVAFTLAVVHPRAGNIGGGGFAVVRDASTGDIRTLDFRETAPAAATPTMYLDTNGEVIPDLSRVGALAGGVPGTVAGLYELWEKYGSLEWEELVVPAAALADTGFIMSDSLANELAELQGPLSQFQSTAEIFYPEGRTPKPGDRLVQADLGATLYRIAAEGKDGFYSGVVADAIVAAMEAEGGIITRQDLSDYRTIWREPAHIHFDSVDVYTMSLPSSGGLVLGEILKLIEPFDTDLMTPNTPEYIHLFTECERLAFADRAELMGDMGGTGALTEMLSKGYLDARRSLIDLKHATPSEDVGSGLPGPPESDQTTHFSVADKAGNLVSLTYTINSSYGSRLVVEGTGFLLNNEMDDFTVAPGVPNIYGLVQGDANKIEPGKRMLSSMSPTIIMKGDRPMALLGARGGPRIISSVANATILLTRFGYDMRKAIEQGYVHHQYLPDVLYLEMGRYDINTKQSLIRMGHVIEEKKMFGDIEAIYLDDVGMMTPVSDPRNRGKADGL